MAERENKTIRLEDICLSPLAPLNNKCAVQSIFGYYQNKRSLLEDSNYLGHFKECAG